MKAKIAVLGILTLALGWAMSASGQTEYFTPQVPPASKLTTRQQIWLTALSWCESRGNPEAINPKDSDGTPSYGLYQFKPGTYAYFAKRLKLSSTTDYMNPEGQRKIVENMILSTTTQWLRQFPDCVKNKIGLPPKS